MPAPQPAPAFIISLDFELYWGVRDVVSLDQYRSRLLGVRQAVPEILRVFAQYGIHATWAAVGFLFCGGRDELMANLPPVLPRYHDPQLSPYGHWQDLGKNETEDPFHFAPSLLRMIASAPGQEIGTHTLSHYCCLEPEQSLDAFRADLTAAQRLAALFGVKLRSLVFPRNQYDDQHLAACAAMGITAYRGNEDSWMYSARAGREGGLRRGARFVDTYLTLHGADRSQATDQGMPRNLPASRFLRPWSPHWRWLEPLRLRRITQGMSEAAQAGRNFHLWWHPHNFGLHLRENLAVLERVLEHHALLRERYGVQSMTMAEAAAAHDAAAQA